MNIERFTGDIRSNMQSTVPTVKKSSAFFLNTEQSENPPSDDPLIYYRELCAEFPNTSFRLSDIEAGMSRAPYSTEEEMRRMLNMDAAQNLLNSTFSVARDKLIDEFLEITDEKKTENSSMKVHQEKTDYDLPEE